MNKEETIKYLNQNKKKKVLLHACCAPCSSGVLFQLEPYSLITIYYYNPNIYPLEEYNKRYEQFHKLNKFENFKLINGNYDEKEFLKVVKGMENHKEGSDRCEACYRLRMKKSCIYAKEHGYDCFTSTLSVSPYKNSELLNKIGNELEEEYGIKYLYSDFKKKEGYKESIRKSKEYDLYRQDYCGCRFSKNEKESH